MTQRFDKFTERARRVLTLAQEEAKNLGHSYIGTEHLLLGLAREEGGMATKILADLGVAPEKVRSDILFVINENKDGVALGEIALTLRAKKVIELAADEAFKLNHHYIGTEHLLLGLSREGEGIAAGILEANGISLERLRSELKRLSAQINPPKPPSTATLEITLTLQELNHLQKLASEELRTVKDQILYLIRKAIS